MTVQRRSFGLSINFLVALGMVHAGLPFSANIAPLAMLFGSIQFLFHGGGPYSLDAWWRTRAGMLSRQ